MAKPKPKLRKKGQSHTHAKKLSAKEWNTRRVTSKDTLLGSVDIRSTARRTLLVKNCIINKISPEVSSVAEQALLEIILAQSYWDKMQGQIEFVEGKIPHFIVEYVLQNSIDLECPEEAILTPRDTKLLYLTTMGFSLDVRGALMVYDMADQINVEDVCFLLSKGTYSLLELEILILSGFRPEQVLYGQLDFYDITSLFALQAASYGMFVQKFVDSLSVKVQNNLDGTIRSYEEPFWDVTSVYDKEHRVIYCYHDEEPFEVEAFRGKWAQDMVMLIKPLFVACQSHLSKLLDLAVHDVRSAADSLVKTFPKARFRHIQPVVIVPRDFPDSLIGMRDGIPIIRTSVWEREISAQALKRSFEGSICLGAQADRSLEVNGQVLIEFFRDTPTELGQRVEEYITKLNHPDLQSQHIAKQAGFTLRFGEAYKLKVPVVDTLMVDSHALLTLAKICQKDAELRTHVAFGVIPQRLMNNLVSYLKETDCEGSLMHLVHTIAWNTDLGMMIKPVFSLMKERSLELQWIGMDKKTPSLETVDLDQFEESLPGETRIPQDISPAEQFRQLVELGLKLNRPVPVRVSHVPLTETLRTYAYGEIYGTHDLQFIYGDKQRSVGKPISRRVNGTLRNPDWESWRLIRLGAVGIRHWELDKVVNMYLCSNRTVSNPRNSSAVVEEYAYNQFMLLILQTIPQAGVYDPLKIELYHTGLEPVIIGFYRAIVDLLNAGHQFVVIPMLYPGHDGVYKQGEMWF